MSRICFAVALLALAGPRACAQKPEWDAKYIKMEVPKEVTADQVFVAKVTMRNTGTQTWKEARDVVPSSLHSAEPADNLTWGTNFFIQGQGVVVAPGQDITYTSYLRAPSEPGKHNFQWRVHGPQGAVGETTPKLEITVLKRPDAKDEALAARAPDAGGKRPLTFDDFEYLGSFKVPETVGKGGAAFSESGLALRTPKDGSRRLFMNYTHPETVMFETDIPDPVKFEKGDAGPLKTAAVKKEWGHLTGKDKKHGANGGFVWDDERQVMYWTYYHGYWTGGDLPVLNASKLSEDGTVAPVGSWMLPRQKWFWGGVTRLPKSFADTYTGGATLGVGFGGYYSIAEPCSRGPALGAVATPDPAKGQADVVSLLGYAPTAPAPRPGDYFNANCAFWSEQPTSRAAGAWTYCDHCRAGVLIDLADKQGYIAFAKLGTGRLGYDYGHIGNAGEAQYWYFYDSRSLGETAKGARPVGVTGPYLMRADTGMVGTAYGACFDEETRTLYVMRGGAYQVGREMHPLVHAYRVKK
ncbi:NBR1-Ig-like domain-containing protein [Gemmata sp. JC717]|uniref:NBR1-Ig-like domain-containing protein n=1 Tax=Gemmata algarum TaxID=2975278 RepID=UPI0021BAFDB5|nr:NBR1-Ig-like domain-containing protein [Gemmata algarum]MDY3551676.1 NBR1-Ig-like domain-containing protein [Gemmata algarum]